MKAKLRKSAKLVEIIRKIEGKWYVYSHDGKKKLGGPYDSEAAAKKRLRQIEYFKHREASRDTMDGNLDGLDSRLLS